MPPPPLSTILPARMAQVTLVRSPPLPPRWTGKAHACAVGARVARDCEWLCFIDADVTAAPSALSSATAAATGRSLDLLSLMPRQELKSVAERLILPCGLILLSFLQDLRRSQARSGREVSATGQFMLVRRAAYEAVGGHAAVCSAICEDLEFARRLKQSGHAVLLMGGDTMLATRMYTGWGTLWPGLAKNLVDTFGGPAATLGIAAAAVILAWAAYLLPLFDLWMLRSSPEGAWPALLLALAGSGRRHRLACCGGVPLPYSFLVRIYFSGRLHGRSPHGARQRSSAAQRSGGLEGAHLLMKLPRKPSDEERGDRARPRRRPARFRRSARHLDRRRRARRLSLFHQTDLAALRAGRDRRLHLDAGLGLGGQAQRAAAAVAGGGAVPAAVRRAGD